jgi:hypothetical protein
MWIIIKTWEAIKGTIEGCRGDIAHRRGAAQGAGCQDESRDGDLEIERIRCVEKMGRSSAVAER